MRTIDYRKLTGTNRSKAENVIELIGDALEIKLLDPTWNKLLVLDSNDFAADPNEVQDIVRNIVGSEIISIETGGNPNASTQVYYRIIDSGAILQAREEIQKQVQNSVHSESVNPKALITQREGTFFYKNKDMKLQENFGYVKAFKVLFENIDSDGFCSYEEMRKEYKKKYPGDFRKRIVDGKDFNTWLKKMLTEKGNGFLRRIKEKNLIESVRGEGLKLNNSKS